MDQPHIQLRRAEGEKFGSLTFLTLPSETHGSQKPTSDPGILLRNLFMSGVSNFFWREQDGKYLGFVSQVVSVEMTQLTIVA